MFVTGNVVEVECGECAEDLELNIDEGQVRSTATGSWDVVYNEDPDFSALWYWDCPDCNYADSYVAVS